MVNRPILHSKQSVAATLWFIGVTRGVLLDNLSSPSPSALDGVPYSTSLFLRHVRTVERVDGALRTLAFAFRRDTINPWLPRMLHAAAGPARLMLRTSQRGGYQENDVDLCEGFL